MLNSRLFRWTSAALVAGGLFYVFRQELAALGGALLKWIGASAPPVPPPGRAADGQGHDYVEASVFGPKEIDRGQEVLIQVFLHALEDAAEAAGMAAEADPAASRRGVTTLAAEIRHGQRVDIVLEAPGLEIEEPEQSLVWTGLPRSCQFALLVPFELEATSVLARARLFADGGPVGSLRFTLGIASGLRASAPVQLMESEARRYRYAFLSYASPDRTEVLKRAQALRAAGLGFFQDLLTLEPGDRWEKRLYEEIDRSDLFLLFWSAHAAASPWVAREIEHALACAAAGGRDRPDIMPIVLDGPPMTPPPDSLSHIHFNDALRYVLAGIEHERRH